MLPLRDRHLRNLNPLFQQPLQSKTKTTITSTYTTRRGVMTISPLVNLTNRNFKLTTPCRPGLSIPATSIDGVGIAAHKTYLTRDHVSERASDTLSSSIVTHRSTSSRRFPPLLRGPQFGFRFSPLYGVHFMLEASRTPKTLECCLH